MDDVLAGSLLPTGPVEIAVIGEVAGSDAAFFFLGLLHFGVGQVAGAAFVFVGDQLMCYNKVVTRSPKVI